MKPIRNIGRKILIRKQSAVLKDVDLYKMHRNFVYRCLSCWWCKMNERMAFVIRHQVDRVYYFDDTTNTGCSLLSNTISYKTILPSPRFSVKEYRQCWWMRSWESMTPSYWQLLKASLAALLPCHHCQSCQAGACCVHSDRFVIEIQNAGRGNNQTWQAIHLSDFF